MVYECRGLLAELLGAAKAEDVIFVRGCTEGLNLVLKGWLKQGDLVAVSPLEHNSVMRPLTRLMKEREIIVETLPADPWGRIDIDAARRLARQKHFALAVVQHASNVNGAMQNLEALRDAFPQTPLLVDAAQTAGLLPLNVERLGLGFLACSLHKGLLGPTGLGVCYLSPRYDVSPLLEGGSGSQSESFEQPLFRPDRYEAGTLNLHGIAGAQAALNGMPQRGLLGNHIRQLNQFLSEELRKIPGIQLHSPPDGSALCISLTAANLPSDELATRLETEYGICCRQGLHCAPAAHRHLGTFPQGTLRISPGWKNTLEQMETTVRALKKIVS